MWGISLRCIFAEMSGYMCQGGYTGNLDFVSKTPVKVVKSAAVVSGGPDFIY